MGKNLGLSLDIKKFERGVCFICGTPCEEFCHAHCAWAYLDIKEKRIKEAQIKAEEKTQ